MQRLRKEFSGNRWTNKRNNNGKKSSGSDVVHVFEGIVQFLAKKIFHCSPTTIMNWVKKASSEVKMPEITNDIKEIEFDEMWHFIGSKKTKNGSSKLLIVKQEKLLPGLRVTVILQPSKTCTIKSNT